MYKRILVPVDGSDTSNKALESALQLARSADGCVRLVHVLDELDFVSGYGYAPDLVKTARDEAEGILKAARQVAQSAGVPAEARLVDSLGKRLGEAVAEQVEAWKADLVVVGTHGRRGIARAVLGSGAEQVVRSAAVPVLVVRSGNPAEYD